MLLFAAIDHCLGRIDHKSLSDQTLMELFIDGLDENSKAKYQNDDASYVDVCDWGLVECDADARVVQISYQIVSGTIQFSFIPLRVQRIYMGNIGLHGSLETEALPSSVGFFFISNNQFDGTVNFLTLPENLEELNLSTNHFSGSCDMSALPKSMTSFEIQCNEFSGSIQLDSLPHGIIYIDISMNKFSGKLNCCNLPETLRAICHTDNLFEP